MKPKKLLKISPWVDESDPAENKTANVVFWSGWWRRVKFYENFGLGLFFSLV